MSYTRYSGSNALISKLVLMSSQDEHDKPMLNHIFDLVVKSPKSEEDDQDPIVGYVTENVRKGMFCYDYIGPLYFYAFKVDNPHMMAYAILSGFTCEVYPFKSDEISYHYLFKHQGICYKCLNGSFRNAISGPVFCKNIINYILEKRCYDKNMLLYYAVKYNNEVMLNHFTKSPYCDLNSGLESAVRVENVALIDFFIQKGAKDTKRAFMEASRNNSLAMVKYIIVKNYIQLNNELIDEARVESCGIHRAGVVNTYLRNNATQILDDPSFVATQESP
jgi:hypothetical protein